MQAQGLRATLNRGEAAALAIVSDLTRVRDCGVDGGWARGGGDGTCTTMPPSSAGATVKGKYLEAGSQRD